MSSQIPRWQITAQDVIKHYRSTGEPISQLISTLCRSRHLGSRDRKQVGEFVYAWIRQLPWPLWFLRNLEKEYQAQAPSLIASLRERALPVLAIDRRDCDIDQVQSDLLQENIETQKSALITNALLVKSTDFFWEKIPEKLKKLLWLMDEASQIVARCINAGPGDLVLDLCAGGGGKTRYLIQTGAQIVAMDISQKRLEASLERGGLETAVHLVADGFNPPFKENTFDWILIDAPCSGTGTLRRAPDLLARLTQSDVQNYVNIQQRLIKNAVPLLKPSGKLIYATCSILPEENRQMVSWIEGNLALSPLPLTNLWNQDVQIKTDPQAHFVQMLPSLHGCDGFFVAAYVKS